ncbi:MAG: hypothetical protein RR880_00040 [Bacteroidales bacterium]
MLKIIELMQNDHNLKGLLRRIKQKYGGDLSTPKDFLCFSMEINAKSGKYLSIATMKRLFGYVKYENEPSVNTLNILSNYIGYISYDEFCEANVDSEDSLSIYESKVEVGDIIEVCLNNSKDTLKLQYRGNCIFRLVYL